MEINEIREALAALPRACNGKLLRIPDELRGEIILGVKEFEGGPGEFARAIGISSATIQGWEKPRPTKIEKREAFRRVEIKTESEPGRFTVDGPRGLKVVGLKLSDVAALFCEVGL